MPKSAFSIIHRVALEWRQWDGKKKGRWSHESSVELRRKLLIQLFHPAGYTLVTPRAGTQNWCCVGSGQLEHGRQQWTPVPAVTADQSDESPVPGVSADVWVNVSCSAPAWQSSTFMEMQAQVWRRALQAHLLIFLASTLPQLCFSDSWKTFAAVFFPFLFSWLLPWLLVHKKWLYFSAAWVNPKNVDRCVVFVK